MIKKFLVSTLVCLSMSQLLIAQEECEMCTPVAYLDDPIDPCCVNAIYPFPANYAPSGCWNFYAKGEFLYLSSIIDTTQNPAANAAFDQSEILYGFQKTPYRPGFRVALGFDLGSAVFDVTYLRYHPHTTSHFTANEIGPVVGLPVSPGYFAPLLGQPRAYFQEIKTSNHISLDLAIFSLQRPVYMGKRIIMNLNYGILALWAGEKWHVTATALPAPPPVGVTSNGVTKANHKSWAVGPNLGFTATALLPWRFQVIAGIDLSLQYASEYKTTGSVSFPNYPSFLGNTAFNQRHSGAHLQAWHSGELGIGWGDYFWCDRYHVNLSVTYNWLFQHIYSYSPAFTPYGTDFLYLTSFSIHGIAVGGRLDF